MVTRVSHNVFDNLDYDLFKSLIRQLADEVHDTIQKPMYSELFEVLRGIKQETMEHIWVECDDMRDSIN